MHIYSFSALQRRLLVEQAPISSGFWDKCTSRELWYQCLISEKYFLSNIGLGCVLARATFFICVFFVCVSVHDCCSRCGAYARDLHSPVHSCASNRRPCWSKTQMHVYSVYSHQQSVDFSPKEDIITADTHLHPHALTPPFLNWHQTSTGHNSH